MELPGILLHPWTVAVATFVATVGFIYWSLPQKDDLRRVSAILLVITWLSRRLPDLLAF